MDRESPTTPPPVCTIGGEVGRTASRDAIGTRGGKSGRS
jgi:hypothetical protein